MNRFFMRLHGDNFLEAPVLWEDSENLPSRARHSRRAGRVREEAEERGARPLSRVPTERRA